MNLQQIIVNADDFGKSPEVNQGIAMCFERKLINRTTLMVNMPHAAEAVELATRHGFVNQVGLHLNLTEGKPLTDDILHLGYTDAHDCMTKDLIHRLRHTMFLGSRGTQALKQEIEAQMQLFSDFGLKNCHVDSHHHIHNELHILGHTISAAKKYGFKSMRILRNLMPRTAPSDIIKLIYKQIQNHRISSQFDHTDFFGSISDYNAYGLDKSGSIEIMVHPVYSDAVLSDSVDHNNLEIQLNGIVLWN